MSALLTRGFTPAINRRLHPNGIAVLEEVLVSESRQWVLMRSENVANPVVLFVHGGPGTSELTLLRRATRPLEKAFTVVNWDQRCAGKSFTAGRDLAKMTIDQFVDDVVALSRYLLMRFHQRKLVLVGHSWGTVIGILAAAKRPDLYSTYIGIGQIARMAEGERISYDWTLEQARRAGDASSVRRLVEIGPPPYSGDWRSKFMTERRLLARYGGEVHGSRSGAFGLMLKSLIVSSEYTIRDRINYFRGILQSTSALMPELLRTDLFVQVPELKLPVYFCEGRHDYEVPSVLSAKYFEALRAPRKQLIWFERSAHMPFTEENEAFNRFMLDIVLPTVVEGRALPARDARRCFDGRHSG